MSSERGRVKKTEREGRPHLCPSGLHYDRLLLLGPAERTLGLSPKLHSLSNSILVPVAYFPTVKSSLLCLLGTIGHKEVSLQEGVGHPCPFSAQTSTTWTSKSNYLCSPLGLPDPWAGSSCTASPASDLLCPSCSNCHRKSSQAEQGTQGQLLKYHWKTKNLSGFYKMCACFGIVQSSHELFLWYF